MLPGPTVLRPVKEVTVAPVIPVDLVGGQGRWLPVATPIDESLLIPRPKLRAIRREEKTCVWAGLAD